MNIEQIINFLNQPTLKIAGQAITVGQWLTIPIVLILGILVTKWAVKVTHKRLCAKGISEDAIHLIQRVIYVIAIAVLVVTTLDLINVPITAFAFISGAVAIGFGFGAQNIINNFISGWILLWEKPIRIGDFLEVENQYGTVEAINTRSSRIRRTDGVRLMVPNSKLLENTVTNWSIIDRNIRTTVRVGVAYGSPVKKVHSLIEQATCEQPEVSKEPSPLVIFEDFADSALVFDVFFWVNTEGRDLRVVRSNIRFRIDKLFTENGIVISFPQRDIHLDGQLIVKKQ